MTLRRQDVAGARARARATGKPHNEARAVFVKDLLYRLAKQLAEVMRHDPTDEDHSDLVADLRESPDVRREINLLLDAPDAATPSGLPVGRSGTARGSGAVPLRRPARAAPPAASRRPGRAADVPLLDEAAELLGEDDTAVAGRGRGHGGRAAA